MSELKKYLQEQYRMADHKDVEEFALEVLKTTKANLPPEANASFDSKW